MTLSLEAPVWRSVGALAVLGTGSALPGAPLATAELLDRLAAWLTPRDREVAATLARRLAVSTRHHARRWQARIEGPSPGSSNPDLAAQAVRAALAQSGVAVGDLGYLIGHTATPAQPLPSNIALVADRLGYGGPHLELRQACTGFANALTIAFGLLAVPGARPVAIVGSETGSAFFDPGAVAALPGQLVNLVQMGDGAAAIVLGPAAAGGAALHAAWSGAIGVGRAPGLQMRRGGSDCPSSGDAPLGFDHDFAAIAASGGALFEAGIGALASHGIGLADAAHIVPHQVSGRIGARLAAHLPVPPERFFVNADRVGNTGSAAIWLALHELRAAGLSRGARVVALGAEATKFMHGGFVYDHG